MIDGHVTVGKHCISAVEAVGAYACQGELNVLVSAYAYAYA